MDYNFPLFVYVDAGILRAPVFMAKYRVKDPQVVLKQKFQQRPKNQVIFVSKERVQQEDSKGDRTLEDTFDSSNLERTLYYSHNAQLNPKSKLNSL